MKIKANGNTFNDRMVKRTVLPAIYLWLLACGAVVGMGIWKPEVVLMNLDGFIALIAIIGGTAAPALQTVLRMWESEQVQEVDNIPIQLKHQREMEETMQNHQMEIEKLAQSHKHSLETSDQSHSQLMDKVPIKKEK
tara:strand:+ start:1072 stop:1482 length:411 start_codon:yes stop_codon:yes gene_type:complete